MYLLDDILSAVDRTVAKHIFQHCILGLLKEKTRIMCTHHVQFLAYADSIVVMEDGVVKKQGTCYSSGLCFNNYAMLI